VTDVRQYPGPMASMAIPSLDFHGPGND
jgi:hypothetical protein